MEIGTEWVWVLVLGFGAVSSSLFAIFLTVRTEDLERGGYTVDAVIAGVLMVLLVSIPLVGLIPVLQIGAVFAVMGLPQYIGARYRNIRRQRAEASGIQDELQEDLRDET